MEKRRIERPGFCRGCDKKLEVGTLIVSMYSHRNRGQHIHFCGECAMEIGALAKDIWDDIYNIDYDGDEVCGFRD
jgi:hypothetical protein